MVLLVCPPEVLCAGDGFIQDAFLALEPLDLLLEQVDVLHPLFVVEVAFTQDGLLDLHLLIEELSLLVAVKQLLGQVVPLSAHLQTSFPSGRCSCFLSPPGLL